MLALLLCLVLAWAVAIGLYGLNLVHRWQHRGLPGPRPKWLLGNACRDPSDPHALGPVGRSFVALQRWAQTYGPVYCFYLGRQPMVVLSDPDLIKEAGVRGFRTFHDRPTPRVVPGTRTDREFTDRGIVVAKGKYWAGVRAACEPLFHQAALESYAGPMNQAVDRLVDRLGASTGSEAGVNFSTLLNGMTMDVIGSTVFSVDLRAQEAPSVLNEEGASADGGNPLLEAAQVFFQPFGGMSPLLSMLFFSFPELGRFLGWLALRLKATRMVTICTARALLRGASQQLLDNARAAAPAAKGGGEGGGQQSETVGTGGGVAGENGARKGQGQGQALGEGETGGYGGPPGSVEAQQAAAFLRGRQLNAGLVPAPHSIISMLRGARNKETSRPLSDLEIQAQLVTFLLAGYETTSLALGYALFELARAPGLQARIRAEVAALGLPPGAPIQLSHLERLPFTEAAFSEALRMYPPASALVALAREAQKATVLGGHTIPAGSHITFNVYALHHDPKHYPDPEVFRPERFLPGSEEAAQRHPFAFIPFGLGPRKCVGYKFAMEEGVLALARLLSQFELAVDPEHHSGPLELASGLTLNPRGGIWLRVSRVQQEQLK